MRLSWRLIQTQVTFRADVTTSLSAELESTPKDKIEDFVRRLREKNITVIVRFTQGEDIAAACGQLAIKY